MNAVHRIVLPALARRPLAAGLALAFSLGAAIPSLSNAVEPIERSAGNGSPMPTVDVTTCDDDGPGSLRAAVAAAASGDIIDLTALSCSTITLTTGFIAVAQDDLSLIGPGPALLAIDAGGSSGLIRHAGSGTLAISGVTISNGNYESASTPRGGCVYSAANLDMTDTTVTYCAAVGTNSEIARGGGIYALGDLALTRTIVTNSKAHGMAAGGHGGGVYVAGNFSATDSTISTNVAYGAPINTGQGGGAMIVGTTMLKGSMIAYNGAYAAGGLWTQDAVTIDSSTIYANGASNVAGMRATYSSGSPTATIVNSTIAGNSAVALVGGLNLIIPATISNTTIAFNNAFNGLSGVLMSGPTLDLESSIIAGNGTNDPDDFDVYGSVAITGANNLVVVSSVELPPDTITSDPLLGTIGQYGGPTMTIPLMEGSPAIDAGNNAAGLATDQRGAGFTRVVGARADIGAFEVQTSDILFADGFDPP